MTEHPADRFELVLKLKGWRSASPGHLTKGDWEIIFDTGILSRVVDWPVTSDAVPLVFAFHFDVRRPRASPNERDRAK